MQQETCSVHDWRSRCWLHVISWWSRKARAAQPSFAPARCRGPSRKRTDPAPPLGSECRMSVTQIALPDDRRPLYTIPGHPDLRGTACATTAASRGRRVVWFNHLGIRFEYHPAAERDQPRQAIHPGIHAAGLGRVRRDQAVLRCRVPGAVRDHWPSYGATILTIFGPPGAPGRVRQPASARLLRFDGGTLFQCAAMKTVDHRSDLLPGARAGRGSTGAVSYVVQVGLSQPRQAALFRHRRGPGPGRNWGANLSSAGCTVRLSRA